MCSKVTTALVSQWDTSSSKVLLVEQYASTDALPSHHFPNRLDMSVTPLVFQSRMWPYLASALVASLHQSITLARSAWVSLSMHVALRDPGLPPVNIWTIVASPATSQQTDRSKDDA